MRSSLNHDSQPSDAQDAEIVEYLERFGNGPSVPATTDGEPSSADRKGARKGALRASGLDRG